MTPPTAPEPRPYRGQTYKIIGSVAVIGVLLLLFAFLFRDDHLTRRVAGAVVFLLGVVPLVFTARAQPASIGRRYLRQQVVELGWFVVAIVVCGLGLLLYHA